MKVKELIEILQQCDNQDAEVLIDCRHIIPEVSLESQTDWFIDKTPVIHITT